MMALASLAFALARQAPPGQEQFVPATAASTEHLPAAPLLVAAYAFVWVAMMFYVWTIWRRLTKVEADMQALRRKQEKR